MKNVGMRLVQPPNSAAEEEGWAPSRKTLIAAAVRVTPIGRPSAAAYHCTPTRQRTIRRSNPTTPVLPRVRASTTSAARKGPKPTIGVGNRSKEYRIQGHHDRAHASTKDGMSAYLLIKDTTSSPSRPTSQAGHPFPPPSSWPSSEDGE